MYKIIGADGNEYGPVTAEQLRQWIAEARANAQSMVQGEGSAEWKPLSAFGEFADALGATPPPAPPVAGAAAWPDAQLLTARDYDLRIGDCIARGWNLFKNNVGPFLGAIAIYAGIFLALGVLGIIPLVSILTSIAQIFIGGPLLGGLYWVFLQRARALPAQASDVFAGFTRAFGHLILVQVVSGILAFVSLIPGGIMLLVGAVMSFSANPGGEAPHAVGVGLLVIGGLLMAAGVCVMIYLTTCWVFALPLVMDRQIGFWDAMKLSRALVRKHWWTVFGFMFVNGLLAGAGFLACLIGALFTAPIALGAMMYAYEDIFGRRSGTT